MIIRQIEREIVSAMIFSGEGKLFLGRKDPRKGGVYSDCWHLPGGGIEAGESYREALVREVFEETGIDILNCGVELIDDSGKGESRKILETGEEVLCKIRFFVYRVNISKNAEEIKVVLNDDLAEYCWVDLRRLSGIKLTPPSVELFGKLGYI